MHVYKLFVGLQKKLALLRYGRQYILIKLFDHFTVQTFIYSFHGWLFFSTIILSLPLSSHSFSHSHPLAEFECHSIQLHSMRTNIKWFKISVIVLNGSFTEFTSCYGVSMPKISKQPNRRTKSHPKEILISQNTELINLTGDEAFVNLISVNVNVERTAQHTAIWYILCSAILCTLYRNKLASIHH